MPVISVKWLSRLRFSLQVFPVTQHLGDYTRGGTSLALDLS